MNHRVTAYGLVLGGLTGIAVGVLTSQVAVWVGIGVALGLIISAGRHSSAKQSGLRRASGPDAGTIGGVTEPPRSR